MAQPQQTNNPHFSNIQQAPNQAAAQGGQQTTPQGQQQPNVSTPRTFIVVLFVIDRYLKFENVIFLETAKVNDYLFVLTIAEVSTGTSLHIKSEGIS